MKPACGGASHQLLLLRPSQRFRMKALMRVCLGRPPPRKPNGIEATDCASSEAITRSSPPCARTSQSPGIRREAAESIAGGRPAPLAELVRLALPGASPRKGKAKRTHVASHWREVYPTSSRRCYGPKCTAKSKTPARAEGSRGADGNVGAAGALSAHNSTFPLVAHSHACEKRVKGNIVA